MSLLKKASIAVTASILTPVFIMFMLIGWLLIGMAGGKAYADCLNNGNTSLLNNGSPSGVNRKEVFTKSNYHPPEKSSNSVAESIATYVEAVALDNSHGYSQARRGGNPDYDCSSLVFFAVKNAGINLTGGAFNTRSMGSVLKSHGFNEGVWSGNSHNAQHELLRGDIVVNPQAHTETYLGGGLFGGARHACPSGIEDGNPGDQCAAGNEEIGIGKYLDAGLNYFYRYNGSGVASSNASGSSSAGVSQPASGSVINISGLCEKNMKAGAVKYDVSDCAIDLKNKGVHASPDEAKRIAMCVMHSTYGWGDDEYSCLVQMWNRESGWRWNAENRGSGAYGIPQSLPADKMASAGIDWRDNAETQIRWGLSYIKNRPQYGSPCKALQWWNEHHWY